MIPRPLLFAVTVMSVLALGMIFFAWRMHGRATKTEVPAMAQPVAPPASGPTEQATLYVASDNAGVLRPESIPLSLPAGRQERAEELLQALLAIYLGKSSPHALGTGSEIRSVYLVDPGLAVIDLNAAFANGHRSGVLVEELTVLSLISTLSANIPGVTRIKILVDGRERETLAGHVDLMNFYDVAAVNQLIAQLQSTP
jgi:Sporulation and spore germination